MLGLALELRRAIAVLIRAQTVHPLLLPQAHLRLLSSTQQAALLLLIPSLRQLQLGLAFSLADQNRVQAEIRLPVKRLQLRQGQAQHRQLHQLLR